MLYESGWSNAIKLYNNAFAHISLIKQAHI